MLNQMDCRKKKKINSKKVAGNRVLVDRVKPKKEEKKYRKMCEKRKDKMIIEIALLLINEFTSEQNLSRCKPD